VKLTAQAPGKVNLCLFLGPLRDDGRHEVVTVLESLSLADRLTVEPAPASAQRDEAVCAGVPGPNIVSQALDALRARGWDAPPVRVLIEKRIPVAAGMGGGSADAAAVLRMASAIAPVAADVVDELAASLGADVPSQLRPGLFLGTGAGEVVERREPLAEHAFVIVPQDFGLSTPEVYREADRLGLPRDASDLADQLTAVRAGGMPRLVNDLEPAAVSLRPEIGRALEAVRDVGAEHAMVSGSGPTVFGLFSGADAPARAASAAARLADRYPESTSAVPVREDFGAPRGSYSQPRPRRPAQFPQGS
jgi:4-diphosphocytidyl-2-C-methyl-D-erythritol kinase